MVPKHGTVYTETVVFSPPEAYVNDVPYQLAIIQFDDGKKMTARIFAPHGAGHAVIGDRVVFVEMRHDVPYFQVEQGS